MFESCTAAIRGTFRLQHRHASISSPSELNADALVGTSVSTSNSTVLHGPAPFPWRSRKLQWKTRFTPAAAGWFFSFKCGSSTARLFALDLMDKFTKSGAESTGPLATSVTSGTGVGCVRTSLAVFGLLLRPLANAGLSLVLTHKFYSLNLWHFNIEFFLTKNQLLACWHTPVTYRQGT